MTKATLQLTTKIRFGSIFSTVIILHNRVRKNKTKLYGITKYASSENTMLIVNSDIQIFDVQIELYIILFARHTELWIASSHPFLQNNCDEER